MRLKFFITGAGLMAAWTLSATAVAPSLSYYDARSTFNNLNPGLPLEDFEEGRITGAQGDAFNAPLSSASANNVFSPGDILQGVTFNTSPGAGANGLFLAKPGYANLFSKALGVADAGDNLDILFTSGTTAVGLDFFALTGASPFELNIYGAEGLLGSASVTPRTDGVPVFFGVSSSTPITRLSLDLLGGSTEFIDNLSISAVPEPSCYTLLGLAGGLFLAARRRKRAAA